MGGEDFKRGGLSVIGDIGGLVGLVVKGGL
jgi:hypothetical protein